MKANAFKFDLSDTGGNLKLFMSVLDKLGVKLDGDQLYEEYQKIYEETDQQKWDVRDGTGEAVE